MSKSHLKTLKQNKMGNNNKSHVILDTDVSEYLQSVSSRTGLSVTYCINQFIRMISKAEQTTDLTLKETELKGKEGKPAIRYKKITTIKIPL